jgi:hypothetical protein
MVMCRYTLQILNCEAAGGAGTCAQHGMLTCRFDAHTERMVAAEFVFDVMGFMQQLQVRPRLFPWCRANTGACIPPRCFESVI